MLELFKVMIWFSTRSNQFFGEDYDIQKFSPLDVFFYCSVYKCKSAQTLNL